jgi:hypothetical protein
MTKRQLNGVIKRIEREKAAITAHRDKLRDLSDGSLIFDAAAEIDRLRTLVALEEDRAENLEEALFRVQQWAHAYPADIFLEPDLKRTAEVLEAAGISMDGLHGSWGRRILDGVRKIVDAVLPPPDLPNPPAPRTSGETG